MDIKEIKISIITSVYNGELYLAEQLNSILSSYNKLDKKVAIEHIIINDGSSDKSLELAKKYEKDVDSLYKVLIISKQNGGLGSARKLGLENANGVWIYQTDADDFVSLNFFEEIIKKIDNSSNEIKVIYFDFIKFPVKGNAAWHPKLKMNWIWRYGHWPLIQIFKRKDFIENGGTYLEKAGDMGAQIALDKFDISNFDKIDKILFNYRETPNSMSKSPSIKHYWEMLSNFQKLHASLVNEKHIKLFKKSILRHFKSYLVYSKKYKWNKDECIKMENKYMELTGWNAIYVVNKLLPRFFF